MASKFTETIYNQSKLSDLRSQYINADPFRPKDKTFRYTTPQIYAPYQLIHGNKNALLIYHGIGTGKTCLGLNAMNTFLQFKYHEHDYSKFDDTKITIITPFNALSENWNNDIQTHECSNKRLKNFFYGHKEYDKVRKLKVRDPKTDQLIYPTGKITKEGDKKYKKIFGVNNGHLKPLKNRKFIRVLGPNDIKKMDPYKWDTETIKEKYNNSLWVIDEVHTGILTTPTKGNKTEISNLQITLLKIFNILNKKDIYFRVLVLSATPIHDKANKFINIFNFLNKINDPKYENITDLKTTKKEDDADIIGKEAEAQLKKSANGLVSFYRGMDPIEFPVRLSPNNNNYPSEGTYDEIIEIQISKFQRNEIRKLPNWPKPATAKVSQRLTTAVLGDKGAKLVKKENNLKEISPIFNKLLDIIKVKTDVRSGINPLCNNNQTGFGKKKKYCKFTPANLDLNKLRSTCKKSKINPPHDKECYETKKGTCNVTTEALIKYKLDTSQTIDNNTKIDTTSDLSGIILIMIRHIPTQSFLKTLLINNGYKEVKSTNIKNPVKNNEYKRFVLFTTGNMKLQDYINKNENKYGKNVRIVILSQSLWTGVSFFNVRQIHMVERWWNFATMEQGIGRAFRRKSHMSLPPEQRNCIVYQYIMVDNRLKSNYSSKDPLLDTNHTGYKWLETARKKDKNRKKIDKILKEAAFDCKYQLNRTNDSFNKTTIIQRPYIKDVFGKIRNPIIINKKDTIQCKYNKELEIEKTDIPIEGHFIYKSVIDVMVGIFRIYSKLTIDQVIIFTKLLSKTSSTELHNNVQYYPNKIFKKALNKLIVNKIPVLTVNGLIGIVVKNGYFVNVISDQGIAIRNRSSVDVSKQWFKYITSAVPSVVTEDKGIISQFNNMFIEWKKQCKLVNVLNKIDINSYIVDAILDGGKINKHSKSLSKAVDILPIIEFAYKNKDNKKYKDWINVFINKSKYRLVEDNNKKSTTISTYKVEKNKLIQISSEPNTWSKPQGQRIAYLNLNKNGVTGMVVAINNKGIVWVNYSPYSKTPAEIRQLYKKIFPEAIKKSEGVRRLALAFEIAIRANILKPFKFYRRV